MTIEAFYYKVISPQREFYLAPLYLILRLVSVFYSAAMLARAFFYRIGVFQVHHLQGKVIGVGNLTLGGVGKTPAVMMIAELLFKKGLKPVILSRGYKGTLDGKTGIVCDGHKVLLTSDVAGDEPVMMAERLKNIPIIVGSNRYESGKLAEEKFGAKTFILDDSFQHLALHRDLNILLCDQDKPFGNGIVFPAGDLREPVSQTKRADLIVITRCNVSQTPNEFQRIQVPIIKTNIHLQSFNRFDTNEEIDPRVLGDEKVLAFCGIGKPDDFFSTLEKAGVNVVSRKPYPDHYRFTIKDIKSLENDARAVGATYLVMTEKDAVKLVGLNLTLPILIAKVKMVIIEGEEVFERLLSNHVE
ncbi:MAG: tetraacyldisaccharide 4'-kinase [Nitrospinales bacterium]